jgi:EAL domain-containing protein (putative c-di-GMP-specific phosphodiesterase class I)
MAWLKSWRSHIIIRTLRSALRRGGELSVVYQPKLALSDGSLVGFEALIRWESPVLGSVSPAIFVPVAEAAGMVDELDEFVLGEVLKFLCSAEATGKALPVAVNVSAGRVCRSGFAERFLARVAAAGVDPSLVHVEVTETARLDDIAAASANIAALQRGGVEVAIDDFGSGYAALATLRDLSIDQVKIDHGFVRRLEDDERAVLVVRGIVEMAHDLGHTVVAEGIETTMQRDSLRELGVDYAQGYLFSRPVPAGDAARLLAAC